MAGIVGGLPAAARQGTKAAENHKKNGFSQSPALATSYINRS
jgi:hypothetical protein